MVFGQEVPRGPAELRGWQKQGSLSGIWTPRVDMVVQSTQSPVMIKAPTISMQGLKGLIQLGASLTGNGLMADLC